MAKIYNSELSKILQVEAGLQASRDKVPDELAEKVVPVINVNPNHNKFLNYLAHGNTTSISASNTIATTSTTKDTFLCALTMSIVKDAAYDGATGSSYRVLVTLDETNASTVIGAITLLTLTAQTDTIHITFPFPIKLKKGSTITSTLTAGGTAGTMGRNVTIYGYTEEPN